MLQKLLTNCNTLEDALHGDGVYAVEEGVVEGGTAWPGAVDGFEGFLDGEPNGLQELGDLVGVLAAINYSVVAASHHGVVLCGGFSRIRRCLGKISIC